MWYDSVSTNKELNEKIDAKNITSVIEDIPSNFVSNSEKKNDAL